MANKDDIVKKAALGATGVVITAGAIAAGVVLANKKNRNRVRKIANKTIEYQAFQHRIGLGKKKKGLLKKSAHGKRKRS